jgi:cardiolipin synthase
MTIVVTGTGWIGGGVGSVAAAMDEILARAESEIHLSAYSFTSRADLPLAAIAGALDRGVETRLLVDHLATQTKSVRARLIGLAAKHRHLYLYDYVASGELHAKVLIADRKTALIGSSNLSFRGLMTNHELGVVVEGPDAASAAAMLDRLLRTRLVERVGAGTARVQSC